VTLSTAPSSAAPGARVNAGSTDFCAVVCAGSAGIHAALVPSHYHESPALAALFAVAAMALALAAVSQALFAGPLSAVAVAGLLLAVAGAYVLSRTAGLPGLLSHPEPFDGLGAMTSCWEVAAAWAVLRPYLGRTHP
jgi:hypothetical protein